MNTAEVVAICQQLTQEGKEPSVALVKSRLTQSLPLPLVIAGLKSFKANPKQETKVSEPDEQNQEPQSLEQRVKFLENEVQELKTMLQSLTNKGSV